MTVDVSAPKDYQALQFEYRPSPDQRAAQPVRHPVVVVGAGPVGLSLAIDLVQQGVPVVLLDNDHKLSTGSRAICFAKRTLEIFDRLGCGQPMVDKGVSWNVGQVFFGDARVYRFNLLAESGHERPAFINLQQYYVEGMLVERALELPGLDLRWQNTVTAVEQDGQGALLHIDTPDGPYRLSADYVVACDGSRSGVRRQLGLETQGRVFHDRFLIADLKMAADFPTERWFWFDPPFHRRQSALLHKQADNVWRADFQLGWDADPDEERKPEHIVPRVRALLAHAGMADVPFEIVWASVYTFSCTRMASFRHGRVLFAGDSAHCVSPFGARGANSGVQDAENLAWKLAAVLRGQGGDALLDSYAAEREYAADENIRNSTRSTDFITPKSEISRLFRDAVLDLARQHPFARQLVNSGRLSVPAVLRASSLNTADTDVFEGAQVPGAVAPDAPVRVDGHDGWFLRQVGGRFTAVVFADDADRALAAVRELRAQDLPVEPMVLAVLPAGASLPSAPADLRWIEDTQGLLARRCDARSGTVLLLRPDQHLCARWRQPHAGALGAALRRALAMPATADTGAVHAHH